jgi:glycosyltransferase involved in cell wall biosynthesis
LQYTNTLVSIGLPVYNAASRISDVAKSVLGQDHENLELIICDNGSTDGTEEVCRNLAEQDRRVLYHRHPVNIGLLNNFVSAMRLATGEFFRWVGDDDWLAPDCVSRSLDAFAADSRLICVTTQVEYIGPDGRAQSAVYRGTAFRSDDPVTRFCEMLRLLNEGHMQLDTLYGLFRREPLTCIDRRNILREDQVFATKLALAGPWGHVPEILARRHWKVESAVALAHKLGVSPWRARVRVLLQCREMLLWLDKCDLDKQQRRRARLAVARMYIRQKRIVAGRGGRKVARVARELADKRPGRTHRGPGDRAPVDQ